MKVIIESRAVEFRISIITFKAKIMVGLLKCPYLAVLPFDDLNATQQQKGFLRNELPAFTFLLKSLAGIEKD